ncbi:hypothetical protein NEUTE1DRAFT_40279 [Neurospora tetrasperma FGSC 2508]|uniref:Uncharacterized protein n=1 Tax=Neurospora tetrasperma (strain FGSC 2508 / ATCC MYA-4615 / P0657) TaxID=510951 RepID=F8MIT5_NEUT8|nr:uncharacterized protein NEUTE1DRAFT_40279 [Neurospora tetrasperma FGSC 2508]EGO59037.1 hypothetical protein NEUTE1DRAFT_40279 [Neurospora tetrasperma FGSC 2508]EGZ73139.1 hypothetical protein NEUTE2DRAFT_62110 [Neurospora tetrasperma FGSC 2509]
MCRFCPAIRVSSENSNLHNVYHPSASAKRNQEAKMALKIRYQVRIRLPAVPLVRLNRTNIFFNTWSGVHKMQTQTSMQNIVHIQVWLPYVNSGNRDETRQGRRC